MALDAGAFMLGRVPQPPLLLREWGEPGYAYELRRVRLLYAQLAAAHGRSGPQISRIVDLVQSVDRGALWLAGFGGGLVTGVQERLRVWLIDMAQLLRSTLQLLAKLPDGPAALRSLGLYGRVATLPVEEFLLRPAFESAPAGLSSASQEALQTLADLQALGPHIELLRTVDSAAGALDFARLIELAPERLVDALASAGAAWFIDLISDDSFESQGYRIGYPVGAGAVELIRVFVEPPVLDLAQLVTLLDLAPDERAALGLTQAAER